MSSSESQPEAAVMASKSEATVTHGGKERYPTTADVLTEAFRDDPAIRYMLCNLTEDERQAYMSEYMHSLMKAAAVNGGVFHEANGYGSVAVWMPPGKRVDAFWNLPRVGFFGVLHKLGVSGIKRMLIEFQPQADAAKKRAFKERKLKMKYWYLFFIGTLKDRRGQGLGTKLIRHFQEIAEKENVPIWLEATTENSMRLYARCGFVEKNKIVLGKGVADSDGSKKEGGEGVPIWCMLWVPGDKKTGEAA